MSRSVFVRSIPRRFYMHRKLSISSSRCMVTSPEGPRNWPAQPSLSCSGTAQAWLSTFVVTRHLLVGITATAAEAMPCLPGILLNIPFQSLFYSILFLSSCGPDVAPSPRYLVGTVICCVCFLGLMMGMKSPGIQSKQSKPDGY
jgi:hypothetical protein